MTYDQIDYAYPRPQVPFWETMHGYYGKIYQVQMVQNGDFRPVLEEATRSATSSWPNGWKRGRSATGSETTRTGSDGAGAQGSCPPPCRARRAKINGPGM